MSAQPLVQFDEQTTNYQHKVSKTVNKKLSSILRNTLEACHDISGAMISGTDGIAWAKSLKSGLDEHRFAAMSSALLALSDNLVYETHEGNTKNVLIESDDGNVFVMHAGKRLLLTVFTRKNSNLGMSLAHAKKAAEDIDRLGIE